MYRAKGGLMSAETFGRNSLEKGSKSGAGHGGEKEVPQWLD